ncbi:UNVERIFIED_CONTAM: protein ANTHESIS POMOTING FACTOR 1 [Sesamum radiatum]|uniref:Protein ANTHESIS POMOTING FACTOR 1 n=1 Tax=Sesamum radiatum TaxID=300843 RepID=A0AAW2P4F7_SESRA
MAVSKIHTDNVEHAILESDFAVTVEWIKNKDEETDQATLIDVQEIQKIWEKRPKWDFRKISCLRRSKGVLFLTSENLEGTAMAGGQPEREDKVSLELTEEILQSMEVGMAFRDYNGRISSMDFHKTSSYLVTASDDESIRLYDVASATCLKTINSKKYGVDLVSFTSHPTTVIYSSKNGWDGLFPLVSALEKIVSFLVLLIERFCFGTKEQRNGLLRVQGRPAAAYDDQGLVFAIAFGGYIRMFDARKYEKGPFDIFSLGGDMSEANVVKFSNDGRLMLLTTSNGHIHVLDSFRGTLLSTYNVKPVSSNSTLEASFSPEGMFVISGSGDGSVYAWSVRSGKEVASWMSTEAEPPIIKWAPGSLMFVTGSSELSFWIPDLSKLAAYVGRK